MNSKKFKFSSELKLVKDYDTLKKIIEGYRAQGKKIAATMGVFDMIHDGHIKYIELARSEGDVLILGLDSDEKTRENKGKDRPFDSLETRLNVLAGLYAVDYIIIREESSKEDDIEFVKSVSPDVLVMSHSSTQYTTEGESYENMIKEKFKKPGYVKDVVMLPPQSSNSTSAKIRKFVFGGAKDLSERISKTIDDYFHENGEDKKKGDES